MKKGGGAFDYYISKEIRRALLKFILLKKINESNRNSYSFVKELRKSPFSNLINKDGEDIKNDIYNTLNSLEKSGYIRISIKLENRKMRRYFVLTRKGKDSLSDAKKIFLRYMKEVSQMID